jgi:hypothetical protein
LFFFVYIYRRDMFTDETTNITISQSAQNIPVDRIDSPYTINIEESRSTLKSKNKIINSNIQLRFLY